MARASRVIVIVLIAAYLGACANFGPRSLVSSASRAELTPTAASAIAGDMVSRLAEHVGPGTGTIVLRSDGSAFGAALETALKGWGYAVATDQRTEGAAIQLAYVLDNHDGSVLARLSTQALDLGRIYRVTATGAEPASPVSLSRRS